MPLGFGMKQLVAEPTMAASDHLWVLGFTDPNIYILDPVTLATLTVISIPGGYTRFSGICFAQNSVWVGINNSGTSSAVVQYTSSGAQLSLTPVPHADLESIIFDGGTTLYLTGLNAIDTLNVGDLSTSTFSSATGFVSAIDTNDSQLVVSPQNTTVKEITIPGGGAGSSFSVSPRGVQFVIYEKDDVFGSWCWLTAYLSNAFGSSIVVVKYDPAAHTFSTITPPAPTIPNSNFGLWVGNLKYNSSRRTIYVCYPAADSSRAAGRIDTLDPNTNAMATLNNTLPINSATSFSYIDTVNDSLWFADGGREVCLVDLNTGNITQSVTIGGISTNTGEILFVHDFL